MLKLILVFAQAFLTDYPASVANAVERRSESPSRTHFYLGRCIIGEDFQDAQDLKSSACLKAKVGSEISYVFDNFSENYWTRYGRGYLGLHLSRWISLHSQAKAIFVSALGTNAETDQNLSTEYFLVRIGNPAFDKFRLSAGRLRLPFGIDRSGFVESLKWRENREFWQSPRFGAYLTIDDRFATQAEIGYATNQMDARRLRSNHNGEDRGLSFFSNQGVSVRVSRDLSILEGSRLIASFYGDTIGRRRFGGAFLTNSAQGGSTHFEFVRILMAPTGGPEFFKQLIRASYGSVWRDGSRWVFQIDDEIRRYRLGSVEFDVEILPMVTLRTAVSYKKSESRNLENRWLVTTGLEAEL